MIITTTNNIENHSIKHYLGIVNANVVIGANLFSDFTASLSDVFGGRSGTYQNKLSLIYNEVMSELEVKANAMNADAVLGLHIDFDEVSGGGKSMFMVSASGTAVLLENSFEDRYAMFKVLNDIYDYWQKGFLSEEEYNYEKKRIIENYNNLITKEVKVVREIKEEELARQEELKNKIEEAKKALDSRCPCTEEAIKTTTYLQMQVADYSSIPYDISDSMESIIAKFVRINKVPEACKYYIDETGLADKDAIEYVLDIYRRIELIDKDAFERLLNKLKALKSKGFTEQAVSEYQKFTLSEKAKAEEFINSL